MNIWTLILGGLIAGTVLAVAYLAGRFAMFSFVRTAAKGRKSIRLATGFVLTIAILIVTGAFFGAINAEICMLHLTVFWLICDGVGKLAEKKLKKKSDTYYAGIAALVITAAYLSCGWFLAHHVWRTEYALETDKPVGSLRIVQFADSHVGNTFSGKEFLKHVKAIQSENPDIVAVTGDYVDDDTSKEDMIAACEALGTLKTTYGVYYVFGNHDKGYYGPKYRGYGEEDLIKELEKNNVKVLQDEIISPDGRFYLIGRQDRSEDQRGGRRATVEELTAGLDPDKYTIVLDHQPHDYDEMAAAGVDLALSGHTHGGQLFPLNGIGEWAGIDEKSYGLEKRNHTNFIVTSGISDWAIQFKTGCKSEYVVVDVSEIFPYNSK